MKNLLKNRIVKKTIVCLPALLLALCLSCSDKGDDPDFAKADTITAFLNSNSAYSEFAAMLKKSGLDNLLSSYVVSTCFVPTNEAVKKYYEEKGRTLSQMTQESVKDLVSNHVIYKNKFTSIDFPDGLFSTANLHERYLNMTYGVENQSRVIYVNGARILFMDQEMHNGVIHIIDAVLDPTK
ncbi:hypothetical protein AGMMS49593_09050 [Endomicrobiia bacterium]|nr:hypothetical protein AGMMS49593_09050 [Endomicrobiia bacterium]